MTVYVRIWKVKAKIEGKQRVRGKLEKEENSRTCL